jgi:DNA primase
MAFPPQFLDEIRARVTLSDVIGRTVKLVRKGREYSGLCPFHAEKTPSFTVNNEKNFYHCFGCGAHGDAFGYLIQKDGVPFLEAVERLAAEAGLAVPKATAEDRRKAERRAGLLDATEAACAFYERTLHGPDGRRALEYLKGRGLTDETIRRFRLGFAPAGNSLKTAIQSDEMPEALLLEAGLIRRPDDGRSPYDFFRDRVIFPILDGRGRVIAFGGRTMGDGEPKYLNSPDTPLFDKRATLYGLSEARRAAHDKDRVLVVEGYMDVIALSQAGLREAVAPLGTALTESHLRALWKLAPEPVLCFDGDSAGLRAAGRAAERALPLLEPEKSLRFVTLPPGEDPDSLVSAQGTQAMEELIGRAAPLDAVIWSLETEGHTFDTPERLAGLEKRLDGRALSIEDRSVQFRYRAAFRDRLRALADAARPKRAFAPGAGRGQGRGRAGNRGGRGQTDPGQYGGQAHALQARTGPAVLRRRLEQVLLAVVVNHPEILDMFAEDLAMVNFSDPKLDNLRQEILKLCADVPDLDSGGLKTHLEQGGSADALKSLLGSDVYVHARFARPDAREEDARSGFLEVLSRHLEPRRKAELEEARHVYVNDPTEENWERFEKLKLDARHRDGAGDAAVGAD